MGVEKQIGRTAKRNIKNYELINNKRSAMFQALLELFSDCVLFLNHFCILFLLLNSYIYQFQFISYLLIIQFTIVMHELKTY